MKIITLSILIIFASIGISQQNWQQFKDDKIRYYSTLEQSNVENFSCLISSSEYVRFIKDLADSTFYYPLKVVWTKEGKVYYIMQEFPTALTDSTKQQQLINKVEDLKKVFKGTLSDWQQFALITPFKDIPENATVNFEQDTVGISFTVSENSQIISLKKTFTAAGELARVVWASSDLKIATYPNYNEIENKWVCQGWKSQFYRDGEVSSGLVVGLELNRIENVWLPSRIEIVAQSKENPGQRSVMQLFLKNYVLNEKFEIVPKPSETSNLPKK